MMVGSGDSGRCLFLMMVVLRHCAGFYYLHWSYIYVSTPEFDICERLYRLCYGSSYKSYKQQAIYKRQSPDNYKLQSLFGLSNKISKNAAYHITIVRLQTTNTSEAINCNHQSEYELQSSGRLHTAITRTVDIILDDADNHTQ